MHRIGTKTGYLDTPDGFLKFMAPHVDYLEFATASGMDWKKVADCGIPVESVHIGHWTSSAVNLVDSTRWENNVRELQLGIRAADFFGARAIVIHPERSFGPHCSMENLERIILENYDSRFILENMPCPTFFCTESDELAAAAEKLDIGVCLDVNHAACYAFSEGHDYRELFQSFIDLQPTIYHFSDSKFVLNTDGWCEDTHINLGTGDIDWQTVMEIMPKDSLITLETPPDIAGQIRDIELIRKLEKSA